jgi:RNase P subunit RPR2
MELIDISRKENNMRVIEKGTKRTLDPNKKKVYRFKCANCNSILEADEDDPVLEKGIGREFHYTCPVCDTRHLMRVCWYSCEVRDSED